MVMPEEVKEVELSVEEKAIIKQRQVVAFKDELEKTKSNLTAQISEFDRNLIDRNNNLTYIQNQIEIIEAARQKAVDALAELESQLATQ